MFGMVFIRNIEAGLLSVAGGAMPLAAGVMANAPGNGL